MKKRKRFIFIAILLLVASVAGFLFMPLSCPVGVYQYFRDGSEECGYFVISDTGASYFFWDFELDEIVLYKHKIEKKSRYSFLDENDLGKITPFYAFTWGVFMGGNKPFIMRRVVIKSPKLAYIVKKFNDGQVYWEAPWFDPSLEREVHRGSILSDEQCEMSGAVENAGGVSAERERATKMIDVLWHSESMRNMGSTQITLSLPKLSYSDNQKLLRSVQSCYPEVNWRLPDNLATLLRIHSSELRHCEMRNPQGPTIFLFDAAKDCSLSENINGYAFYYHGEMHNEKNFKINFEFNKNNEIISDNKVIPLISPEASE